MAALSAVRQSHLPETANHTLVVDIRLELNARLHHINRAHGTVGHAAAKTAGKRTLDCSNTYRIQDTATRRAFLVSEHFRGSGSIGFYPSTCDTSVADNVSTRDARD